MSDDQTTFQLIIWHFLKKKFGHKCRIPCHFWPLLLAFSGLLWRTSQNTINVILIQWHANKWQGILHLCPWKAHNKSYIVRIRKLLICLGSCSLTLLYQLYRVIIHRFNLNSSWSFIITKGGNCILCPEEFITTLGFDVVGAMEKLLPTLVSGDR